MWAYNIGIELEFFVFLLYTPTSKKPKQNRGNQAGVRRLDG